MLPLDYKKGPWRTKKLQRREVDEDLHPTKLGRKNTHYKCDAYGHNSRSCISLSINPKAQLRNVSSYNYCCVSFFMVFF